MGDAPVTPPAPEELPSEVAAAIEALLDRQAIDVVLLDLAGISTATNYFLVASGRSDTHVSAIADHVIDALKERDVRPAGVEGQRAGRWVLVDYIDWVVHVFHPEAREFYQLERLWGDAPCHRLSSPEEGTTA